MKMNCQGYKVYARICTLTCNFIYSYCVVLIKQTILDYEYSQLALKICIYEYFCELVYILFKVLVLCT